MKIQYWYKRVKFRVEFFWQHFVGKVAVQSVKADSLLCTDSSGTGLSRPTEESNKRGLERLVVLGIWLVS